MKVTLFITIVLTMLNVNLLPIVALANLNTAAQRTALRGNASWFDVLTLVPGLHVQQLMATELHKGEYPACAALTTGYVFRVENPATVNYLQRVGQTGKLVTVRVGRSVVPPPSQSEEAFLTLTFGFLPTLLTQLAIVTLLDVEDYPVLLALAMLVCARCVNVVVIQARARRGGQWKGAREPGVSGDLLVLLSQDRWVRIKGLVDDLKATTSGLFLADPTPLENAATSTATLLVYAAVGIAAASTIQKGSVILTALLCTSTYCLEISNAGTRTLNMHGRKLWVDIHGIKKYARRRDLAEELIEETGRRDWAVAMGMVPPDSERGEGDGKGEVVM